MNDIMLRGVLLKGIRDQKRALIGWSIALAGLVVMMGAYWPAIEKQAPELEKLVEGYPPALRAAFDMDAVFTPAGYLKAELFTFMLPILFLIYAIGRASDTLAGEEERGGLDLLLSQPITRRRVLLEKAGAVGVGVGALCLVTLLALVTISLVVGIDVSWTRLASAMVMLMCFTWAMGALALAMGAWRGRRAIALMVPSAVAAVSYLVLTLSKLIPDLAWTRWLSPFHYYFGRDPLVSGLDVGGAATLLVAAGALVAFAAWAFERRDIGV